MNWFSRLFRREDPREAELLAQKAAASATVDAVLARVREGRNATDEDLTACTSACTALYEALSKFHGKSSLLDFSERDRVDYYVFVLKLTAIGHPDHDAWPFLADVRRHVIHGLLPRRRASPDPWLDLCAITPALLHGDVELARQCHASVKRDPFLARLAEVWVDSTILEYPSNNDVEASTAFLEAIRRTEPWNEPARRIPPERRWILLASPFPSVAVDPRATLGDTRGPAASRKALARWWNVTSPDSARDVLDWLLDAGHSAELERDLASAGASGKPSRIPFLEENRAALERFLIRAWDLGRTVQVARASFTAGYLDEDETWEWLAEAGIEIRETYDSWAEYGADYALGSTYFDPSRGAANHAALTEWLARDPRSPWKRVRFGGTWPG